MKETLIQLRELMTRKNLDVVLIPSSDFHGSEYIGDYFKARAWMSGFTGSAGTLVITAAEAGLWTDGRYFIQAEQQLKNSGIDLFRMGQEGVIDVEDYLAEKTPEFGCLAVDGRLISAAMGGRLKQRLDQKQARLDYEHDWIDEIWTDRPCLSQKPALLLDETLSGKVTSVKLNELREAMKQAKADWHLMSSLDDIAWLFNLRGSDVQYNPVVLSYALIVINEARLYLDRNKLSPEDQRTLCQFGVELRDYNQVYADLRELHSAPRVWADLRKVNMTLIQALPQDCTLIDQASPVALAKAVKNEVEIENLRLSHLRDGVAVTRLMFWLKQNAGKIPMSESSIQDKLHALRCEQEGFLEESFQTICAYKANAAMMHYSTDPEHDVPVEADGLLLIDSGGQYWQGTTDITRTFVLGNITREIKKAYTAVLQGMLNLSSARFLYGCSGINLDILARGPVWKLNLDYQCGTGHGVGYLLNVHEGPHGIRWKKTPALSEMQRLEPGMVVTDEPGIYIEGKFGIRLENELIVQRGEKNFYGQFLEFETTTLAPIDLDGIEVSLLSEEARQTLNRYHKRVAETLSKYMNEEERQWLNQATRSI